MSTSQQLNLFALPPAVAPALAGPLASAPSPPKGVRLGTSSWSFPGWEGLVYARRHGEPELARDGLAAYAHFFGTVSVDRAHYRPLSTDDWRAYAAAVAPSFRFVAKAHEATTLQYYPDHARYGAGRGQHNGRFLDAAYAAAEVVGPYVDGAGERTGPLLFQFAPQATFNEPVAFARRLGRFLRALPRGPQYAVEVRNPELLGEAYAEEVHGAGAIPCLNVWGVMPALALQAERVRALAGQALIIRWMLPRELDYEGARQRYLPFDRLIDERPDVRAAIVTLTRAALEGGKDVFIIVNNKAEGSAPWSVLRLLQALRS